VLKDCFLFLVQNIFKYFFSWRGSNFQIKTNIKKVLELKRKNLDDSKVSK